MERRERRADARYTGDSPSARGDVRPVTRDYDLLGSDGERAVRQGLASAEWYHSDVPRARLKALMKRRDGPAVRDTVLWLGSLSASGAIGAWLWPTPWCLPFFAVYGVLYGSAGDSRWHECGHGTAFRTGWMNDAVYQIASFFMIRNPVTWRWSHVRHHSDTIIVGRDPEISQTRPPKLHRPLLNLLGLRDAPRGLWIMLQNALGRLDPQEASYVPEEERPKVFLVARIWLAIYTATVLAALLAQSWLPLMLVGLPRLYGAWHQALCGLLQHAGLADNVLDHRLNSRTVLMNPVSRFVYWNMNYHVEHHMFPMVPYHRLPELHALIRDDLPAANPGFLHALREVLPVLWRQRRDPEHHLRRELPPTARAYRPELHEDVPVLGGDGSAGAAARDPADRGPTERDPVERDPVDRGPTAATA